ncbi:hypothetical protein CLOSCI_02848 [[Clostridium] scindens ATCC 35704]|nr:hypothetical protein CLOSCI_02848 [[Clostridium] scindens ATCC 35704]
MECFLHFLRKRNGNAGVAEPSTIPSCWIPRHSASYTIFRKPMSEVIRQTVP